MIKNCIICTFRVGSWWLLIAFLSSPPVFAKKMYRWIDENGKTHLSDTIPPDQVQHRRELLSNDGRVLQVTEQAKTKEQRELDARLAKLKKEQDKIIAKQKSDDKVLLSTYRSVDDMKLALNKKMMALDSEYKVLQNNLNLKQTELEKLLKRAAGHERNGEKVPKPLLDSIDKNKAEIQIIQEDMIKHRQKRETVRAEFESDMDRYRFLTQEDTENPQKLAGKLPEISEADALGLYECRDDSDCLKAWDIARRFVKTHSTTGIDIDNDRLVMAKDPVNDTDLSLSISIMTGNKKNKQLFLDIRCRPSSKGDELCSGQTVSDLRSSFRTFVESGLNN